MTDDLNTKLAKAHRGMSERQFRTWNEGRDPGPIDELSDDDRAELFAQIPNTVLFGGDRHDSRFRPVGDPVTAKWENSIAALREETK